MGGSDLSNGYAIKITVGYYSEFKRAKTEWWLEKSCLEYQQYDKKVNGELNILLQCNLHCKWLEEEDMIFKSFLIKIKAGSVLDLL